jgi:hypothetical protein
LGINHERMKELFRGVFEKHVYCHKLTFYWSYVSELGLNFD